GRMTGSPASSGAGRSVGSSCMTGIRSPFNVGDLLLLSKMPQPVSATSATTASIEIPVPPDHLRRKSNVIGCQPSSVGGTKHGQHLRRAGPHLARRSGIVGQARVDVARLVRVACA